MAYHKVDRKDTRTVHETTIQKEVIFQGNLIDLEVLDVRLEDGTFAKREVVRHPGAVAVIVEDACKGYIFVRQFRKPIDRHTIEIVAGTREPDEDGEVCARREVEEETGCRVVSIAYLGDIFPTPGYVEERIQVYVATAKKVKDPLMQDQDERVESLHLSRTEFEQMVKTNQIQDAKTLAAWMLYGLRVPAAGGMLA